VIRRLLKAVEAVKLRDRISVLGGKIGLKKGGIYSSREPVTPATIAEVFGVSLEEAERLHQERVRG